METNAPSLTNDLRAQSRKVKTRAIESHVPCHACGYDLFALHRNGLCPECGTSIDDSFQTPPEKTDPSATFLKLTFVIVATFALVNLIHANHDPRGAGVYLLVWGFMVPVSILTAFFSAAQGELSWALYWIGLFFVSFVAVHMNGPLVF